MPITVRDIWNLLQDNVVLYVYSFDSTAKYFYAAGQKGHIDMHRAKVLGYFDFEVLSMHPCEDDSIYVQIPHVKNSIYEK